MNRGNYKNTLLLATLVLAPSPLLLSMDVSLYNLHTAARKNQVEELAALLQNGAEANAVNDQGATALHLAAAAGHQKVVGLLLAYSADVRVKTHQGETAYSLADDNGHEAVAEMLRALTVHNAAARNRGTSNPPVVSQKNAAANGQKSELKKRTLADCTAKDSEGKTALHRAAEKGLIDDVDALLAQGADCDAKNNNGGTPLHAAAYFGHGGVCAVLIDGGASINEINKFGNTALHVAALKGHEEVCKVLMERGIDVTIENENGHTALEVAQASDKVHITYLLSVGANKYEPTLAKLVPVSPAEQSDREKKGKDEADGNGMGGGSDDHPPVVKMQDDGCEPVTLRSEKELQRSSAFYPPFIRMFSPPKVLENGKKSNKLHNQLIKALEKGSGFESVMTLIDQFAAKKSVSLDALNTEGLSPLMIACGGYRPSYLKEYHECDICNLRVTGYSCCYKHSAPEVITFFYAHLELAQKLLQAGADPNIVNSMGITPLISLLSSLNAHKVKIWESHDVDFDAQKMLSKKFPGIQPETWTSGLHAVAYLLTGGIAYCVLLCVPTSDDRLHWASRKAVKDNQPIITDKERLYQLIKDMLKKGVDVNYTDAAGISTLMWAVRAGDAEVVKILLEGGANPHAVSAEMKNEVLTQVINPEIIKNLIRMGVDSSKIVPFVVTSAKSNFRMRNGHSGKANNNDDSLHTPTALDMDSSTALCEAAASGRADVVKTLLTRGANVNALDNNEENPLHHACRSSFEVAKLLLARKADAYVKNNFGLMPFQVAAQAGKYEIVDYMLKERIGVPPISGGGLTPLHTLVAYDISPQVLAVLVANGLNVNAKAADGVTPLFLAKLYGNNGIADALVARGALPLTTDEERMIFSLRRDYPEIYEK